MIRVFFFIFAFTTAVNSSRAAESTLKLVSLESGIACVQAGSITKDFARQLQGLLTNKVSGLVLDLRFADGSASVSPRDLFPGYKAPIVVLVNEQTRGAAAQLTAGLRTQARAIVIGGTNATGNITPDIKVTASNDQERRFQENPYATLEKPSTLSATNELLPFIDHTSEAELVRRRVKDGDDDAAESPRSQPEQPVIRDPALARALDFYKALAVLGKSRG